MTQVLYAALAGRSATSDLYTVDDTTAVMTSVGPIGDGISGLAVDPTDGTLYGTTNENSGANPEWLVSIDPTSGFETLIGQFLEGAFNVGFHEIAFDSTGQLWGLSNGSVALYTIDKTTAAATQVNAGGDRIDGGAFDFDVSDTLWLVGGFVAGVAGGAPVIGTIDTTTGLFTQTGSPSDGNYIHSGKFDGSDLMWASSPGEAGTFMGTDLITVDTATGTVTVIGSFSTPSVGGLAWVGTTPTGPFTLAASPASFSNTPGGTMHSTVTSTLVSGSPENITLSNDNAGSLPTGVTVVISPTVITDDGGTATVTIHTTGATPLGSFSVSILGDDGMGGTAHTHITVHLVSEPPGFHIAS